MKDPSVLRGVTELWAYLVRFTCRAGAEEKTDIIILMAKESSPWKAEADEKRSDSVLLVSVGWYLLHLVLVPKLNQLVLRIATNYLIFP